MTYARRICADYERKKMDPFVIAELPWAEHQNNETNRETTRIR